MSGPQKENIKKKATKCGVKRTGIRKNRKDVFITRLRMLLDDPNITTMSWHPSGKAVMVDKRYISTQVKTLFPECFGNDKFTSIRQNLGAHGFKSACKRQNMNDGIWKKYNHVLNSNRFLHIYEHPLFRRDKPESDKLIKRIPVQRKHLKEKSNNSEDNEDEDIKSNEPELETEDDQEPETARLNSDHDHRPHRRERMRWKFYSADDEDYKVRDQQDQESDESHTPITEEDRGEPTDAPSAGVLPETTTTDCKPAKINPVQDLESPVLGSLEELEDTVLYSVAEDMGDWEREKMKPEIQSSSIWKPMTSPLGDPNAQMTGTSGEEVTDTSAKRCETPVDLSTREKIKTPVRKRLVRNTAKPISVACTSVAQSMHQNSSDDDVPDEETCSTLAAFCQAKVTAVYSGMIPDESPDTKQYGQNIIAQGYTQPIPQPVIEKGPEIAKRDQCECAKVVYPMPQLIPIAPPPAKKFRFAKPNKVKINLSMPLCSAMQSTTLPERYERAVPEVLQSYSAGVSSIENNMIWTNPAPNVGEELRQSLLTASSVCPINTEQETSATTMIIKPEQSIPVQANTQLLQTPESGQINDVQPMFYAAEVPAASTITLAPVAYAQIDQTTLTQNMPLSNTTTTNFQPTTTSNAGSDVSNKENVPGEPIVSVNTSQKLPSIDQIFKPLPQTSLVTTPSVAANVEVTSLSVPGRKSKTSSHPNLITGEGVFAPTGYAGNITAPTKNLSKGSQASQKISAKNNDMSKLKPTTTNGGRNRYPAANKMNPYMYPYPPTSPGYMRWPGPYPWPPYMSMPGRYPPYYPCHIPNYNSYPH